MVRNGMPYPIHKSKFLVVMTPIPLSVKKVFSNVIETRKVRVAPIKIPAAVEIAAKAS